MGKGRYAKDGLIQYCNVCQQGYVKSLEEVIKHFIHLSIEKAEIARNQAQALEDALTVEDLESDKRPEDLMLSFVSGEKGKDRSDREVVTLGSNICGRHTGLSWRYHVIFRSLESLYALSRSALLLDLVSKGLMSCVLPEVKDLIHLVKHEFLPLNLCLQAQPMLNKISSVGGKLASASSVPEVQLSKYAPALEKLATLRLLQQASQVYHTMTIEKLLQMELFEERVRIRLLYVPFLLSSVKGTNLGCAGCTN